MNDESAQPEAIGEGTSPEARLYRSALYHPPIYHPPTR
jgi:hypothetical protein